jgi:hypothetical protein
MTVNKKHTSKSVASLASETLHDPHASQVAKSLAASALSQRIGSKQTGAQMEDTAARVLANSRSSEVSKTLAATVLSQANKAR